MNVLNLLLLIIGIIIIILLSIFIIKLNKIVENKIQNNSNQVQDKINQNIDQSQHHSLLKEQEEIEKNVLELKNELEYLKKEKENLEKQKIDLEKNIQKLSQQNESLKQEIEIKQKEKDSLNFEIAKTMEKAKKEADEITRKAIEKLENVSKEWENLQKQKQELWEKEKELSIIKKEFEIKIQSVEEEKQKINQILTEIKQKEEETEKIRQQVENELQKISQLTPEQAKEILLKRVEEQIKSNIVNTAIKIENESIKLAEQKAKRIILNSLSRIVSESVAENTIYSIQLPSEDFKGRIIGKEGRNIKAFEEVTGVDLIIDDNSEVVFVSSFDPIRREKARLTLEKLLSIGKINPIAIQEVYEQVEKEIDIRIQEEGENACLQAKIFDLHPDLVTLVGKMKYRASYGQNLLKHSIEVSKIAAILAAEVGANVEICRRAAFLHDIGKVLDDSNGEPHAIAGAKIAKIYGEREEVVRAIASHHNEVPQETIEDLVVQIADAISASRPGARKETFQIYLQRLQKLEEIAMSFNGVEKAFVLQGGKEVIVFVKPEIITDTDVYNLAKEISKAIESNLKYPGVIRVTVIRKVIAVQLAK
ncbi:MAG: ribonuclease Y [bacterium]